MAYDHTKALKNLTDEQSQENFDWMFDSYHRAIKGEPIQCRGCWEWLYLWELYRCFFCGSYFCSKCAHEHFGPRN